MSNSPQIRNATMADLTVMAHILADGFHDDAAMTWSLNSTKAIEPMMRIMGKDLYLPKGFGAVSEAGDGATFWLKPGTGSHIPALSMMKIALNILRHGGTTGMKRSLTVSGFMEENHPKQPHYYLFAIATLASARGKGVGGALLKDGLAKADADGIGTYLENSKQQNLGFYQAHGFELLEEVTPAKGAPSLWRMWREPQQI